MPPLEWKQDAESPLTYIALWTNGKYSICFRIIPFDIAVEYGDIAYLLAVDGDHREGFDLNNQGPESFECVSIDDAMTKAFNYTQMLNAPSN